MSDDNKKPKIEINAFKVNLDQLKNSDVRGDDLVTKILGDDIPDEVRQALGKVVEMAKNEGVGGIELTPPDPMEARMLLDEFIQRGKGMKVGDFVTPDSEWIKRIHPCTCGNCDQDRIGQAVADGMQFMVMEVFPEYRKVAKDKMANCIIATVDKHAGIAMEFQDLRMYKPAPPLGTIN